MPRRNELEDQALQIIINRGPKGILQSELWRELGANSRDGSRISLKLEKKNLIIRKREMSKGRWSYRLSIKRPLLEIDSILDIPCISCENITFCVMGGEVSPIRCKNIANWLITLTD
ncbi:MAG: hypothetical protein JSV20_00090 [Candidatus Bathyarchaeota archaeon]|nr:MAG: hypothetical protein JSV20_00090 [Candidatus Bathyarchaeota archaeon]